MKISQKQIEEFKVLAKEDSFLQEIVRKYNNFLDEYKEEDDKARVVYEMLNNFQIKYTLEKLYKENVAYKVSNVFMIDCYEHSKSFTVFYYNFLNKEGLTKEEFKDKVNKYAKILLEELERVKKDIINKFTVKDMEYYIMCNRVYKFYRGFINESVIIDYTEMDNVEFIKRKDLESKYAIDFIWKESNTPFRFTVLGQEKSISFLNKPYNSMSCYSSFEQYKNSQNYYYNNSKAGVRDLGAKSCVYIFHDEDSIEPLFFIDIIDMKVYPISYLKEYLKEKLKIKKML